MLCVPRWENTEDMQPCMCATCILKAGVRTACMLTILVVLSWTKPEANDKLKKETL